MFLWNPVAWWLARGTWLEEGRMKLGGNRPSSQWHKHMAITKGNEVTQGNVSTSQKWHVWSSGSRTPPLEAGDIFFFAYLLLRSKNSSSIVLTQKTAGPHKPTHWGCPCSGSAVGGKANFLHPAIILGSLTQGNHCPWGTLEHLQ